MLLFDNGKLLLQRRLKTAKEYPNIWETPGGKIEPGESRFEAAEREVMEELNIRVKSVGTVETLQLIARDGSPRTVHHILGKMLSPKTDILIKAASEIQWIGKEEFNEMVDIMPGLEIGKKKLLSLFDGN